MTGKVFSIFYLVILVFVVFSFVLIFGNKFLMAAFKSDKNNFNIDAYSLESLVRKDDIELRTKVFGLITHCSDNDSECKVYSILKYVSALDVDNSTLIHYNATNNYSGQLYFSSLLINAGLPNKLVLADNRLFVAVCGLDRDKLYTLILNDTAPVVLLKDYVRIAAGQVWFASPDVPRMGITANISVRASDDINLYVFISGTRIDMNDKWASYPECGEAGASMIDKQCFIEQGNAVAVYAPARDVAFDIVVTERRFTKDDMVTAVYGGESCIVLDPAHYGDWAAPMSAVTAKSVRVINIQ